MLPADNPSRRGSTGLYRYDLSPVDEKGISPGAGVSAFLVTIMALPGPLWTDFAPRGHQVKKEKDRFQTCRKPFPVPKLLKKELHVEPRPFKIPKPVTRPRSRVSGCKTRTGNVGEREQEIGMPAFATRDAREGPCAVKEKRKPNFEGR